MAESNSNGTPRLAQPLKSTARGVLISANPRAGADSARARVLQIEQSLRAKGYEVRVVTELEELSATAQHWQTEGRLRVVMAAGGDGTASAVRNAIPAATALLPLPLGTECLLARHVAQSAAPEQICETVSNGLIARLDAGRAGERIFLLMISAGIDAEVVHRMQSRRTGHITHVSYVKPTLQSIRSYEYPELRLYRDEEAGAVEPVCCRWLLGFNLPCYARGLRFAPEAVGTDGQLDVCTFGRGSLWHSLRFLWHVSRGKHLQLSDTTFMRGKKFRIEATDGSEVAVQVDGDMAGRLPIDVEVLPDALSLLVSAEGARRLGFAVEKQ